MFLENICISVSVLKRTLNFGITKIGSNELYFGRFKSQNARLGFLYLPIKFHRNYIFLGLPKMSVNLLPMDWTTYMRGNTRFGHVTATSPYCLVWLFNSYYKVK
jgi:hypothetical protein